MSGQPAGSRPRHDGRCREARPATERPRPVPPSDKKQPTPVFKVEDTRSNRSGKTLWFLIAGLALFGMIRLVGAGDSGAARDSVENRITEFERGKTPEQINYNDPVYGKAIEDLRNMANGPDGSASVEKLLRDLEAKQRDFEVRMRQNQQQMEAKLAERDTKLAQEIATQQQSTGTDPEAANRLNEQAKTACAEDGPGPHKH